MERIKADPVRVSLIKRLEKAYTKTPLPEIQALLNDLQDSSCSTGRTLNRLMTLFKETRSVELFAALYDYSLKSLVTRTFSCVKRYNTLVDHQDILQEVYISIYRYAHSFREEHENSFRNWSQSIIRNAIFKQYRKTKGQSPPLEIDPNYPDNRENTSPLCTLIKKERYKELNVTYFFSLAIYLHLYRTLLNPREKKAVHLVESEMKTYKEAAAALGVSVENFKMILCRARKKIFKFVGEDRQKLPQVRIKTTG